MGQEVKTAWEFRRPMQVRKVARYRSGEMFPVCPQCGSAMEREYQRYCDRCGQRLGWERLRQAQVVSR